MTENDSAEQVHDSGTTTVKGAKIANAAAETLHGGGANEEKYEQPDAALLPGGNTLIAKAEPASEPVRGKTGNRLN